MNTEGEKFPLGQDLSNWISRDLLESADFQAQLTQTAAMARYKLGNQALNDYLYRRFNTFNPGTAHLSLVQLPWDVIYTTNYDLLVEKASTTRSIQSAGRIKAIVSSQTDLGDVSDDDIVYYKLHGSIDLANTEEGRLILTREDYRHYELHRKPLFKRLSRDLQRHTLVFVGYSLLDSNLQDILEDCRSELGALSFPASYAIRPGFNEAEAAYWKEKYNIQFVDATADQFLSDLKDAWIAQDRSVVPLETRLSRSYVDVDFGTRFPKVGESFYRVAPADCTAAPNPELFFKGGEPSWADIRDEVAPKRDAYWTVLEALFPELTDPSLEPAAYLVTGAAGTGKTTLVYSLAYDLAKNLNQTVLIHIPSTPLDAGVLAPLVDKDNPSRIVLIVRHASELLSQVEQIISEARRVRIPLTIILEERRNQWLVSKSTTRTKFAPAEFELGSLSEKEIDSILGALAKHGQLGKLFGTEYAYQRDHFKAVADRELLVALREITSGTSFDQIIRDEFEHIPSAKAKEAYVYVAALGQLDLAIRYETLVHLIGLRYDQLGSEVFQPTEGVLISCEEMGGSRYTAGFRLRTRHPIIASIIFAQQAPDDDTKFEVLNQLLHQLDPGFNEDRRLLEQLVRRRELVNTFASIEKRRAIYERLASVLPNNPYVYQHRSILERDIGDGDQAIKFARDAVRIDRGNAAFQNTLGFALEFRARTAEALHAHALIQEASRIFDEGMRRDASDPYNYIGKLNIIRQQADREADNGRRKVITANALSLLEEAYEATNQSEVIGSELAQERQRFGDTEDAIAIVKAGLQNNPADTRLRVLWVRLEAERGKHQEALRIAMEGTRADPTSWRLQRQIARLKQRLGEPVPSVRAHYETAIRHRQGDISLLVELGAFLFMNGLYPDADTLFRQARELPVPGYERSRVREMWKSADNKLRQFTGRVSVLRGAMGYTLAIPENFEAFFWRTNEATATFREGRVGFTK